MKGVLALLLGPSGTGKSTIIRWLSEKNRDFTVLPVLTTRPLRAGEVEKLCIASEEMERLESTGALLLVNHLYGTSYGTPLAPIVACLQRGDVMLLDWPVDKVDLAREKFPRRVLSIYLMPPSGAELRRRLRERGETNRDRLRQGLAELRQARLGVFDRAIDAVVASGPNSYQSVASNVEHLIRAFQQGSLDNG